MGRQILVVKKADLFKSGLFNGFVPAHYHDFLKIIKEKSEYQERNDELENNEHYQQILPYVWIINPEKKEAFIYRRASDKNYTEKRLRNKISGGVGGHIDKDNYEDAVMDSMMRELREEVQMTTYTMPKIVGYIKLNHDVHAFHFAVVGLLETKEHVTKGDDEMTEGTFQSIDQIEKIFADPQNDVEEWTTTSWPFVKEYLLSNIK